MCMFTRVRAHTHTHTHRAYVFMTRPIYTYNRHMYPLLLFINLLILGMKSRALHMLVKYSITKLHYPSGYFL